MDTKDEVVKLRISSKDAERWREAAEREQRSLSDWIRVVVNKVLRRPKR